MKMKKKLELKKYKKDRLIEVAKTFQHKEKQSKIDMIRNNSKDNKNNKTIKENIINLILRFKNKKKENSTLSQSVNQNQQTQRNIGVELARIIAIYFIINLHILYHGGPLFNSKILTPENNLYVFFAALFNSGVNIFGMISGFVGYRSHKFGNLLHLLIQTSFYNYGIAYYFSKTRPEYRVDPNKNHFIYPAFIIDYWYFTAYFIMYFLLPLINSGINSMDKRKYGIFNFIVFLFFSCFYQIKHYSKVLNNDLFSLKNGFSYIWLLILYFFGGYFGKFNSTSRNRNKFLLFILLSSIIVIVTWYRTKLVVNKIKFYNNSNGMKAEYTAPSCVIVAVCFIMMLTKLEIKINIIKKIISFFGPLTYGIYLTHNHLIVRTKIIANNYRWLLNYHSYKLLLMEGFESFKIFMLCAFIDYIRFLIFKALRIKQICLLISSLFDKICNGFLAIFEIIY